jgi:preprotein translocase subunit SecD
MSASAAVVLVAGGSLAAVIAASGHSENATVRPVPASGSVVATTLTPLAPSASAAELRADAAVITRRLSAAGIHGEVKAGAGSITLNLPASAAGAVPILASTGRLSFRIPSAVNPASTVPASAAGCVSAAGPATGSPPPCIVMRASQACPKAGTDEAQQLADAPATDWIIACDAAGTAEYILAPQRLGGDAVSSAKASIQSGVDGTSTGTWIVTVQFTPSAQGEWASLTAAIASSAGCPKSGSPAGTPPATCELAIVFDGVVQTAPIIQERIAGPAEITGSFTEPSAKVLAAALSSGTLPVPLAVAH